MASFNIHLAIGKRYVEKFGTIKDEKEFYKGIIEPDLADKKEQSHYSGKQDKTKLLEYLENKVQLKEYLKNNNIDSDYEKGVVLHLITDYIFFNEFFDKNYLNNISYEDFCKDLYYSYGITNEYLENKYKIDYEDFIEKIKNNISKDSKEKNINSEIRRNILEISKLDKFIEDVSNISLEEYKNKITA